MSVLFFYLKSKEQIKNGKEINYDLVYQTFLEEKKLWNKDSGRMYAHNIISWHKDEQITPEQAFEFGKEFAEKWF